jgi:hypothetical protein
VRLDRKLLLIAPTIVLLFVAAGVFYAAMELRVLTSVGDSFNDRSTFVAAVERGEKTLNPRQAAGMLRLGLDVEAKRTAAIDANRQLLMELGTIAAAACVVLIFGIRSVPREHWPRLSARERPIE